MPKINDYVKFGISPSMLYPASFDDDYAHLAAVTACCRLEGYDSMETFLPDDAAIRKFEIQRMRDAGLTLHYNTGLAFQIDGPCNAGSDDPAERAGALSAMKAQVDYAAEAEAPLIVVTGCADKGPEKRPAVLSRYTEYFYGVCAHAKQYGITVVLEPIERDVFKKLVLGPTPECAAFIRQAQEQGYDNAMLMLDTAHLPLMDEEFEPALKQSLEVGLYHIHMGEGVLDPKSVFYGHTHPPICVHNGLFGFDELTDQFYLLLKHGYIPGDPASPHPSISLEVRPYQGVSEETSARFMYETMNSAFLEALHRFRNS